MGIKSPGRRIGKRLVIFLLLLLPMTLSGLEMEILPDTLITGRVITLKIQTEIPIEDDIEVSDLELTDDLVLISGPVIRTYYKRVDGKNSRFHQITWALRSSKSGIFNLPTVEVKKGSEVYVVEVPTIMVFDSDEKDNNFPLIVEWKKDIKKEIFVGESLPLIVEAYNLEEINFPDRVVSGNPASGELVEVSGLGEIHPEDINGNDLYRVAVSSWIYTTFEAGRVRIPPIRVDINGLTRYTEALILDVKPLPKVNATGGVGEFIITTDLSESQVTPEDTFNYKVRISGQGNLPYIKFPNINYYGLILINSETSESIEYSEDGYVGWREINYTFQAVDSGVKELSLSEVSWIDKEGKDIFFNGAVTHINVVSVKVVEEDILPFLSLMTTPEIISSYSAFLYKKPLMWLLLITSLVLYLIVKLAGFSKSIRDKRIFLMTVAAGSIFLMSSLFAVGFEYQGELVQADNFISEGDFLSALNIYDSLEEKLPNNYGLFVNRAILWDKLENLSQAVYNIRIAERIAPDNSKIRKIKDYLSDSEESRQKQARTVYQINPDYAFILLVIFFNFLVLAGISLIRRRNITMFSIFLTTILFTLVSGAFLLFVNYKNSVDAGVISRGGADLVKVPNSNALEWIVLDEGNCVYINGEWQDKYLIETEYGLQGWVGKDSILVLEER